MPKDPAELVLPLVQPMLGDGEALRGWCLATEQTSFSGHTTGGEQRKLTMMRGGGGMFGKLGGGEAQQQGIDALAEWLRAAG